MDTFMQAWLPLLYLYGVGGLLFGLGIVIIRKSGAINLQLKRHRFWYKTLFFGFIYFMLMHTILTIAALYL